MKTINILFSGLILCLLSACGSKEPSPLVGQTDRLNGELTELAEGSPLFMSEATASYTDGTISVTISLSDPDISAQELTDPLLQFVVAKYMQLHSDDNLITTLNALGKEKGTLSLTVEDAAGGEKVLVLPSATLKRLATAKPMDLRIGDVRLAVLDIMDRRCKEFREAVKAESCEFDYVSSFAQYTFTFASPNQFSNLNAA
ncbi:MAG: hypothetical protein K2M55_00035, partial [Muribaculaceae bacterium]|nr:hypothetical protein [Muribaculaceae bacterium]